MARLRVRVEVKRPQPGLPLDRLADLAGHAQKLLRLAGKDAPLGGEGYWVARNFTEGSLGFDIEYIGEADDDQVRHYNRTLTRIASYRPNGQAEPPAGISADAVIQYAKVAEAIDVGETLQIGVFETPEEVAPKYLSITKQESWRILEHLQAPIEYHGMAQGIIHSLFKESNPAHFDLRELATEQLVRCYYLAKHYAKVVKLLTRRDAVVLVAGQVKASRVTRKIDEIHVDRMEEARRLTEQEYAKFFGYAPNLTGKLTTSAFLSRMRRNGD